MINALALTYSSIASHPTASPNGRIFHD
jgi:hypothetical protein